MGFTLIELLAVVAIILALVGISVAMYRPMMERTLIQQAQTEMSQIRQALEQFRLRHGDYPRVPHAESRSEQVQSASVWYILWQEGEQGNRSMVEALRGRRGVTAESPGDGYDLLEETSLRLILSPTGHERDPEANPGPDDLVVVDPWDRVYRYFYDPDHGSWAGAGYLLYSVGPTGSRNTSADLLHAPPGPEGVIDHNHPHNLNNIYLNQ